MPCKIGQVAAGAVFAAEIGSTPKQVQGVAVATARAGSVGAAVARSRGESSELQAAQNQELTAGPPPLQNTEHFGVRWGAYSKRARINSIPAHNTSDFAGWEEKCRAEMIARQRVVGLGLVLQSRASGFVDSLERKQEPGPVNIERAQKRSSNSSMTGVKGEQIASVSPGTKPAPQWCPYGLNRTQKRRIQRLRAMEIAEKKKEEERDRWFNQARPVVSPKKTWREKRLAREEGQGGDGSGNDSEDSKNVEGMDRDVNMVFILPDEFKAPEGEVAELMLGIE
jgi:hypothetical protein